MVAVVVFVTGLTGCTIKHDYVWQEYPITEDRVTAATYSQGSKLNIIKGECNREVFMMGSIGPHEYYGSLQTLSDGIADQLAETLELKGITPDQASEKSLTIRVTHTDFEQGMWKVAATIDYEVAFTDGKIKKYSVRNSSPTTVEYTFNGAVALAVIEIMNDPEMLAYINQ